ncbi:CCAAT- binding transcription factor component [Ophidiomyces ophidiicola]|uniref:CCAAT- binding transcription factor component n=1 Tax=Ophidiomyces ophidiicola TaxID=1387563 RepID=UPI0020C272EF|nr:CCAAT- binding transcription factor component [Ophidiomyces ophidiicola]KAI1954085.1 CCAAT- binding transcription factor component [Ophidiomyces ophidiicola]KAI2046759.1 CCAAT- binding transcription factor component [Ophidiomyces ophidiicola]
MEQSQAGAGAQQSSSSRQRHHHHQPQEGQVQQQQSQQQPVYDIRNGGHYGACTNPVASGQSDVATIKGASAALSAQGYAPSPDLYTGTWANVNQGLTGTARDILTTYWQQMINHLESDNHDYKIHQLPLARIKKVMKADPEVKMISAEAPILFAKGCDIFITELTMRAWIHAEDNKRRTLQRSDIAAALAKSDMFDFLIDIVPREEATSTKRSAPAAAQHTNAGQIPPQQPGVQQPHHMGPPDYGSLGQPTMGQEQDYRPQTAIYGGAVQSDPGYGQQPQIFEGMYGYSHLPPQQVCRPP